MKCSMEQSFRQSVFLRGEIELQKLPEYWKKKKKF